MFDPERMLGGLLRSGTRRSSKGMGSLMKGGVALGLVGIAWEAVEHYLNKAKAEGAPGEASPPGTTDFQRAGGMPPPPPPKAVGALGSNSADVASPQRQSDALLLIRAMVAAANADGTIDETERKSILTRLDSVQLSPEEQQFIARELLDPKDIDSLAAEVKSPELARQVYMASVLAIEVDTDEELEYLQRLAQKLNLDRSAVQGIHEQLGLAIYFE